MLHTEQQRALEEILECDQPVFVTGSAGTGKSYLLKSVQTELSKRGQVALAAPTGIAALNIGGITLHSLFGLSTDGVLLGPRFRQRGSEFFQSLSALLIDEVSMVRVDHMDNVDRALRFHRQNEQPFGGLKIVLFGDLFQLPPILRYEDYTSAKDPYGLKWKRAFFEKYFFLAPALLKTGIRAIELTHIHRQGSDLEFAEILNRIRRERATASDFEYLNSNSSSSAFGDNALRVFGTNEAVDRYNLQRYEVLGGREEIFTAEWNRNRNCPGTPLRSTGIPIDTPVEVSLRVRPGTRVMFTKNDDQSRRVSRRWVNGSLGTVSSANSSGIRVVLDSGELVTVARSETEVRELVQEILPDGKKQVYGAITGWMTQYPLKQAWAVTVHKSQGQTLENVVLDFQDQYFEAGQAYVALSRARSLGDIHFESQISSDSLKPVSTHIKSFMEKVETYPFDSRRTGKLRRAALEVEIENWCESQGLTLEQLNNSISAYCKKSKLYPESESLMVFLEGRLKVSLESLHQCLMLIYDP